MQTDCLPLLHQPKHGQSIRWQKLLMTVPVRPDLTINLPDRFTALPGYGVEAFADGTHILAGNRRLMEERKVNTAWADIDC